MAGLNKAGSSSAWYQAITLAAKNATLVLEADAYVDNDYSEAQIIAVHLL